MARKAMEECLICGETPCACFSAKKAAKKKPVAKKEKATEAPQPKKKLSPQEAMKAAAAAGKAAPQKVSPSPAEEVHAPPQRQLNNDEVLFAGAVRALKEILHPDEIERYRGIVTSEPSTGERALLWRLRKEGGDGMEGLVPAAASPAEARSP
jgi:hypothetical protein